MTPREYLLLIAMDTLPDILRRCVPCDIQSVLQLCGLERSIVIEAIFMDYFYFLVYDNAGRVARVEHAWYGPETPEKMCERNFNPRVSAFSPLIDEDIGRMYDIQAAQKWGLSVDQVRGRRKKLGIPPFTVAGRKRTCKYAIS